VFPFLRGLFPWFLFSPPGGLTSAVLDLCNCLTFPSSRRDWFGCDSYVLRFRRPLQRTSSGPDSSFLPPLPIKGLPFAYLFQSSSALPRVLCFLVLSPIERSASIWEFGLLVSPAVPRLFVLQHPSLEPSRPSASSLFLTLRCCFSFYFFRTPLSFVPRSYSTPSRFGRFSVPPRIPPPGPFSRYSPDWSVSVVSLGDPTLTSYSLSHMLAACAIFPLLLAGPCSYGFATRIPPLRCDGPYSDGAASVISPVPLPCRYRFSS